ncbi:hypothetical protein FLONG3_1815 [Fusarium longipes]|uniref:Uncharacterized protein n=1 Tax=Fusarium longipes TaxID=694270 RepID=A0A395T5L8_9HYPO|nr:hypothetical protein FLONG3_1815 [Fusarium longipes]
MSRKAPTNVDAERLPDGFERVEYDAQSQIYSFRDSEGCFWQSSPGNYYGVLKKVEAGSQASIDFRARNPQFFSSTRTDRIVGPEPQDFGQQYPQSWAEHIRPDTGGAPQ